MIDAFLMMYQTDCVECVTQSGQKTVKNKITAYRKDRAP